MTDHSGTNVAIMSNGPVSFILQNFYVKEWAENFMLQLAVPDADAWWAKYDPVRVSQDFGTQRPTPPALQHWGLKVGFIHDPSGVLWHVTEIAGT